MELSTVLTYIALLITAYGATQEYVRLKLKLTEKKYVYVFVVTFVLLYLSTLEFIQFRLIIWGVRYYPESFLHYLWESKYLICLTINLWSLYKIIQSTKLNKDNQQQFLNLVHELRGYKNYSMLNKLIDENLDIIFQLKFFDTYREKAYKVGHNKFMSLLMQNPSKEEKLGIINSVKKWTSDTKENLRAHTYHILGQYSYDKNVINEIFQYCISDKLIIQTCAEQNEPLGIKILEKSLKYSSRSHEIDFQDRFLITVFKNRESYIYKEYIKGKEGHIYEFVTNNQSCEGKLDIGRNIAFAILELLEDNQETLALNYEDNELRPLVKQINELFEAFQNTDPKQSEYSNLPFIMQKVILKNIDLSVSEESVGFHFLNELYGSMKTLSLVGQGKHIEIFNSLYYSLMYQSNNVKEEYLIQLGCHYVSYVFPWNMDHDYDSNMDHFKDFISRSDKSEYEKLLDMFLILFDKRRDRGDCEDYTAYTGGVIGSKLSCRWNEILEFLEEKKAQVQQKEKP